MLDSKKIFPAVSSKSSSSNLLKPDILPQASFDNKFKKLTENIDYTDDDKAKNRIENFRLEVKQIYTSTPIGELYNQILLLLSGISCFQFIYQTYLDPDHSDNDDLLNAFSKLELVFAAVFTLDWCLSLFIAEFKIAFLTSFFSMIDLMTVIPIFVTYRKSCPAYSNLDNGAQVINYILCGMSTTRILRALRLRRRFLLIENEVQRFLSNMTLNIIVMILFNSALMQYLEPDQHYRFHTWTYYMLVTVATVGYGDISPHTDLGRFAAMAMISFAIVTVPQMTNELIEKMTSQSVYARAKYTPKGMKSLHVLVCGDLKSSALHEFFSELFHEDHEMRNLHAVVLQPSIPTYEMLHILKDISFQMSITYLEGSPLNDNDLKRALASKAKAIFIMTNKFSSDPDEEDAKTILQQFSIQRHLRLYSVNQANSSKALFCMQLIRPENKRHLVTSSSVDGQENPDIVICLNEIKMGVIAKAVIFPGANTLIMNLLTSFSDDKPSGNINNSKMIEGIETLEEDEDSSDWIGEYQRGCDWEIYTSELSSVFEGAAFCHLSEILYQKLGIVLFGLEIEDLKKDKSSIRIVLNPADFVIPSKNDFRITAFVIAKNKAQSDLTFSKSSEDSIFGSGISFSHLSMLTNAISNRVPTNLKPVSSIAISSDCGNDSKDKQFREKHAWQVLLRKYEAEKTSETIQEELQKLDDKYLRENYYVRDVNNFELSDAYVKTSVTEEMPFVENHIIIVGKALSNLYDLIRPLRSRSLGVLKHVIILYPGDFPLPVWQRISIFDSIWIVRGSALEEADIRRCGIFKAKQVVLLAEASNHHDKGSSAVGMEAMADVDAIFCYQAVKRLNETAHVVVEIVRHTNVGYLDPESGLNSSEIDYKFTPQFASGALFATSLLDTLVCQSFYNTKIVDVINKLVGGIDRKESNDQRAKSGKSATNVRGLLDSALYQIPIPEGLESRTYGSLFKLLSRRKQIPLGILRGVFNNTKSGPKANKMPYVFTNPPKDTELFSCDKVFILSQTPIRITRITKDETKEMNLYSTIRTRKKTTEDVLNVLQSLRDELHYFQETQQNLDRRVEGLSLEVKTKFDYVLSALECNPSNNPPTNGPTPQFTTTQSRSNSRRPSLAAVHFHQNNEANNISVVPSPNIISPPNMRRPASANVTPNQMNRRNISNSNSSVSSPISSTPLRANRKRAPSA